MDLLPEPAWSPSAAECIGCGYSLSGLMPPTVCPECGLPYSGSQLVCHGVADARSTMSKGRMAIAAVLVLVAYVGVQALFLIGLMVPWWVTLCVAVLSLTGVVYFVASAPRSYGGTARLVFDCAGATVLPMSVRRQRKGGERWTVCGFKGNEAVELKQVSDTWAKLRIRSEGKTVFSGGVQLPANRRDEVADALRRIVSGSLDLNTDIHSRTPADAGGPD